MLTVNISFSTGGDCPSMPYYCRPRSPYLSVLQRMESRESIHQNKQLSNEDKSIKSDV